MHRPHARKKPPRLPNPDYLGYLACSPLQFSASCPHPNYTVGCQDPASVRDVPVSSSKRLGSRTCYGLPVALLARCVGARPQACRLRTPFRRRAFASTPTILGAPQASTRDLRPECHPQPGNGSSNQFFHLNFSPTRSPPKRFESLRSVPLSFARVSARPNTGASRLLARQTSRRTPQAPRVSLSTSDSDTPSAGSRHFICPVIAVPAPATPR